MAHAGNEWLKIQVSTSSFIFQIYEQLIQNLNISKKLNFCYIYRLEENRNLLILTDYEAW